MIRASLKPKTLVLDCFPLLQVESAWTICKLSSTLSWLEVSMGHESVVSLRISSGNFTGDVSAYKNSIIGLANLQPGSMR